jgi:hypothetical protein
MSKRSLAAVLVWALTGAACASAEPPRARLAATRAALRSANELGAEKVPKAQLHIQLAQESIARAEHMMQEGNNDSATFALMRAQSDAELALSLAREEPAKREAQAALEKVSRLKPSQQDAEQPAAED